MTSQSSDNLELNFLSDPANVADVRKSIEQFCMDAGLDEDAGHEVGLVVNEALANVIRHAYLGKNDQPVTVRAEKTKPGVRITIRDWGNGVNPSAVPWHKHDPQQPGGLGLMCMSKLMDGVTYHPQPDGMLLEMQRSIGGSKFKTNLGSQP